MAHLRANQKVAQDPLRSSVHPTTAEPAWHRRLRAQRAAARRLISVAKGAELLASHHGSSSMPPKKNMPTIQCKKRGCTGTCPAHVIIRGYKKDGIRAKCLVCDQTYAKPSSAVVAMVEEVHKGAASDMGRRQQPAEKGMERNEIQKLQQQVAALQNELVASKDSFSSAKDKGNELALGEEESAAAKAIQKQIQQLRELDPKLRDSLCESKGGYETVVANLQKQRQDIYAKHRGTLPMDIQKTKSELHVKNMQRNKGAADDKLKELQLQKEELDKKLAAQVVCVADAEAKLQAAKLEAATIAQAAAAQVWSAETGSAAPAAQGQVSILTAAAVKGFFQSLPTEVAQHPEGAGTISQVMALLEKLDSAAKQVGAPVETSRAAEEATDMDWDMELNALAEAAVGPLEEEGQEAKEEHSKRIAEAKFRIAKVKKTSVKK